MAAEQSPINQTINELVASNKVVLFMKGTRHFPQCGFSATVAQILDELVPEYHTVNVLKDPEIRQGIKEFSNWPTIPQLYVDGKFVGGCDIIREMYVAGELQSLLGVQDDTREPRLTVTEGAKQALRAALTGEQGMPRLAVSSRFDYELSLDEPRPGDYQVDAGGFSVLVDRMSAKRADGITIDYTEHGGGGFKIENPNAPAQVKQLSVQQLKAMQEAMQEAGEDFMLVDVRTEDERARAQIAGARLLDAQTEALLDDLDRDTPLVFHCHHGGRSQAAAERYLAKGFKNVFNVTGGIDAWSREIDPSVPRY